VAQLSRRTARLKPRHDPADAADVLTTALISALLLGVPVVASWVLVRRAGHPAADGA
jgi:hypothetical protein